MRSELASKTVGKALRLVLDRRSIEKALSEKGHTQWIVNRLLSAAVDPLRTLAEEYKVHFSPAEIP